MTSASSIDLESLLGRFRLRAFRPGQHDVITSVLAGRDCLCIMPTGGGKSLCYQLPAIARGGVTLVISPLIALMKDQVDALQHLGMRATYINSSLAPAEQQQRLTELAAGHHDLVYAAPERLRHPRFLEAIRGIRVQLLAVDEAHCISQWGHDFRPDYSRLGQFRERLGFPQTIALTATATPDVRRDVVEQLRLRDPCVFVTGFARPNLSFEVLEPSSTAEKERMLIDAIRESGGAGIVYASTRRKCEEVQALLATELKKRVGLYHAGLATDDRRLVQEAFMRGDVEVMVATNAFGMGIDKADLRFVVHFTMPGSLEAYYQEAGRAGRDGKPARCLLLFSFADRYVQEFFIENAYPSPETVRDVYEYLIACDEDPIEITLEQIKERLGLPIGSEGVGACERLLEKCGAMERLESQQNMASFKLESDLPTLVDLLPREAHVQRRVLRAIERLVGERRFEWVYLAPAQVAAAAEMDRTALQRALHELKRLNCFDYVPPFRGRAIHVLRRDLPFEALEIDFAELARRKAAELARLDQVIRYAQTRRCRQLEILNYFGDLRPSTCGCCDNCRPHQAAAPCDPGDANESVVEAVRIALSGAARARGRVGKHLLAKMLCGSRSAQINRLQLDQLSTFGLLRDLKQTEAVELVDALLTAGLLEQHQLQPHRPTVQLTAEGQRVMRGEVGLSGPLPLSYPVLVKLRHRPCSRVSPRRGPGSVKTTPACTPPQAAPPDEAVTPGNDAQPAAGKPPAQATAAVPNHYWTWRLLADDYGRDDCLRIRQIDEATLLGHLVRAAADGMDVRPEWFLTEDQVALLEKTLGRSARRKLRSVVEELPPELSAEHVQLYLKCRNPEAEDAAD